MTYWQKIFVSLGSVTAIFFTAWAINNLIPRYIDEKWNKILRRPLKKAVISISLLLSCYVVIKILELPENQLIIAHKFIISFAIMVATFILASIATSSIVYYRQSGGEHAIAAATLTRNMVSAIIFILGLLVLLHELGIAITPMLTAMGIGGIAIALGLQDTLSNIFAGLYIIWAGRMKIGDYVKLNTGEEGYVHDIAWRETRISNDRINILTIPNSLIAKAAIINYSRPNENVEFSLKVGVDYRSDLDHVEQVTLRVAQQVLKTVPGGLANFTPSVRYKSFADFSIILQVKVCAENYGAQSLVKHELLKQLHRAYNEEGIVIPSPVSAFLQMPYSALRDRASKEKQLTAHPLS